ncbi:MAG TPA: TlpA disulfide reductase family protein [Paludibacteraceae bacterium]|jgi:thiol-disulfide isomerase/thioredoxin|nr:TlpA disulfide reductase family protein [Paludibacteraceae bacterium]HQB68972.1 TlpA disulfide reductase family protein [Paludibacteraceae bacterium]HRS68068.1 TlpA disulfide reductase family protein [Paludibacteraceae bacterium]
MKKNLLLICLFLVSSFAVRAQAYTNLVGQPTPNLIIEKWISPVPDLQGKFIVIDFWATWCGPCRVSIPHMNALAEKYAEKFVIIGLSKEPESVVRNFRGMNYYSAIDTRGRLQATVGVRGIPNVMIVDPQGIVCWQGHPVNLTAEVMDKLLEEYAKKVGIVPSHRVEILLNMEESYDPQHDKGTLTDEPHGQILDAYDHM